jgi:sulfur-oxidizing protein SoxY
MATQTRRAFLQWLGGAVALMLLPLQALATLWNDKAFKAQTMPEALSALGMSDMKASNQIRFDAPDKAENGAIVQILVESLIQPTDQIVILAEKNPTNLIAQFNFLPGADPYVITRIKMAESAHVYAVIRSGSEYFFSQKYIEVLENGCG